MTITSEPRPFSIEIPEADIADLRERLSRVRYPALPDLPESDWSRGVPAGVLRRMVERWTAFDWRAAEVDLNRLPHHLVGIDGQPVHFVHVRSEVPGATPLLLLHGWPSSFLEFDQVVPLLVDPAAHGTDPTAAFHLVIPSLPGFGFSTPLVELGWSTERMAGAMLELMTALGYERFGVHGGDTGAFVGPAIGRQAPERVVGVHVNALVTFAYGTPGELDALDEVDRERHAAAESMNDGYMQIQAKAPTTLGYALADSPVAQLAWIVDIYQRFCDVPDGATVDEVIGVDRLLTAASLYWFTSSGASSAQVYYEDMSASAWDDGGSWSEDDGAAASEWDVADDGDNGAGGVPTAVLVATRRDTTVRAFAERDHPVVRWTEVDDGGHFFATERPEAFAADVRSFFTDLA